MSKVVFPVLRDGLLVDVVIGLDRPAMLAQLSPGQLITAPVLARGEIDTGSNVTAVSSAILHRLGIAAQYRTTTQIAAGGVLMQPTLASAAVTTPNDTPAPSAEAQKILTELQKLDQASPQPSAGAARLTEYNSRRADILARLVA